MCCLPHLAGFDGVGLIEHHDLGSQRLQLLLQLGHKVVAGDEELELLAFQLAVLALGHHVDTVICDAQPLMQSICPLLCRAYHVFARLNIVCMCTVGTGSLFSDQQKLITQEVGVQGAALDARWHGTHDVTPKPGCIVLLAKDTAETVGIDHQGHCTWSSCHASQLISEMT